MPLKIKTPFEQISELIHNESMVIDYLCKGGCVIVEEAIGEPSSIDFQAYGDGYTYLVERIWDGTVDDDMVFNVHTINNAEALYDRDYDCDNSLDCRNCPDFYLKNGELWWCAVIDDEVMNPLDWKCGYKE